jgi:Transposase DDE domain group 1
VKVEETSMGTNIRYIVTNLNDFRTRDLYEKGFCARGSMELRIKDHKLYLKSDRSSCTKFTANQFRLFLHSMAYILIHTLQKQVLKGTEYANATMKTIQLKIIKTAAWVKEMKTKIRIELPQFCTTKNEQIKGFEMLLMLRT